MDDELKGRCISIMNKVMSNGLSRIFAGREDIANMFSRYPILEQNVPSLLSFSDILTNLNANVYPTPDAFAADFRHNMQALMDCVVRVQSSDNEFHLIANICEEILIIFEKRYSTGILSEEDQYRLKLLEIKNEISSLLEKKPENFEGNPMISEDVMSFNPTPIPTKVFPL